MKNTKKISVFIAGILALALMAGSWAYFSASSSINNQLGTGSYGGSTIEEFTPDQTLQPGTEVIKTVGVTNTGDYDLVVRIKMDEEWSRNNTPFISFASTAAGFNSVGITGTAPDQLYNAAQGDDTDGLTAGDETVIYKNMDLTDWVYNGGYWYYKNNLTPGASTGSLLQSLIMADNADMGKYTVTEYYSTADKTDVADAQTAYNNAMAAATTQAQRDNAATALNQAYGWVVMPAGGFDDAFDQTTINFKKSESLPDSSAMGYADADYCLTITTELCQATADAVQALWGAAPTGTDWTLG